MQPSTLYTEMATNRCGNSGQYEGVFAGEERESQGIDH
ncbi:Uncharacterised protein [Mycobacteroides abscessus subsp. abscessus]|nr:Uncharacterised protein [Mycobacteroides abscessus subsp. abscessus]SII33297.1 Uncharacterised protein [Mycobacteroides abscessus subsp. abscessus]